MTSPARHQVPFTSALFHVSAWQFNTLRLSRTGRHLVDNNSELHFREWKSLHFDVNFTEYTSIYSDDGLVSCRYQVTRPLSQPILPLFADADMHYSACVTWCIPKWWHYHGLFANILRPEEVMYIWHFQIHFLISFWLIVIENCHQGQIINRSALLQVDGRYWTDDRPISEPMMIWFMLTYVNCKALIE